MDLEERKGKGKEEERSQEKGWRLMRCIIVKSDKDGTMIRTERGKEGVQAETKAIMIEAERRKVTRRSLISIH